MTIKLTITGCTSTKSATRCKARDMYTSAMGKGRAMIGRAAQHEDGESAWMILSAFYGLITPNVAIEPYDLTLADLGPAKMAWWREQVVNALDLYALGRLGTVSDLEITVYAGKRYVKELRAAVSAHLGIQLKIVEPLEGKQIGERLAWYAAQREARIASPIHYVQIVRQDKAGDYYHVIEDNGVGCAAVSRHVELEQAQAAMAKLDQVDTTGPVQATLFALAPVQDVLPDWERIPYGPWSIHVHYATGAAIRHCGHQTANYPYTVDLPGQGAGLVTATGHGFKTIREARQAVELWLAGELVVTTWGGCTRFMAVADIEHQILEPLGLEPRTEQAGLDVERIEDKIREFAGPRFLHIRPGQAGPGGGQVWTLITSSGRIELTVDHLERKSPAGPWGPGLYVSPGNDAPSTDRLALEAAAHLGAIALDHHGELLFLEDVAKRELEIALEADVIDLDDLQALADDAAALGDVDGELLELATEYRARASSTGDEHQERLASYAESRREAIVHRLAGRIEDASRLEALAEQLATELDAAHAGQ